MHMLARFRCSSHNLQIETDRKHGIEKNQRLCRFCEANEIEDEFHFLLICSFIEHLRKKYIDHYYYNPPSEAKFTELLTHENVETIQRLAAFMFHAFNIRNCANELNI